MTSSEKHEGAAKRRCCSKKKQQKKVFKKREIRESEVGLASPRSLMVLSLLMATSPPARALLSHSATPTPVHLRFNEFVIAKYSPRNQNTKKPSPRKKFNGCMHKDRILIPNSIFTAQLKPVCLMKKSIGVSHRKKGKCCLK